MAAQFAIDGIQTVFDQFEAFQIGRDSQFVRGLALTAAVGIQARVEGVAGVIQRRGVGEQGFRLRAQIGHQFGTLRTEFGAGFIRRGDGEALQVVKCCGGRLAGEDCFTRSAGFCRGGHLTDQEGETPAVGFTQFREAAHAGVADAGADGAVQTVDGALAVAFGIGKVSRRRFHAACLHAVALAVQTMTRCAVVTEQLAGALNVGCHTRYDDDVERADQAMTQFRGRGGDVVGGLALFDHLRELTGAGLNGRGVCGLWAVDAPGPRWRG